MLIQQKAGNINSLESNDHAVDYLHLQWYESGKRILHKRTGLGKEITLKFLKENADLTEGDIIYRDDTSIIVVSIVPCEVMIIDPRSMYDMAAVCYEIGNKHLPLFYEDDKLMVPWDAPLFRLLTAA